MLLGDWGGDLLSRSVRCSSAPKQIDAIVYFIELQWLVNLISLLIKNISKNNVPEWLQIYDGSNLKSRWSQTIDN